MIDGDFNGDGLADGLDYAVWQLGFGANYDGDDFLTWQRKAGTGDALLAAQNSGYAAVPESKTVWIALAALASYFLFNRFQVSRASCLDNTARRFDDGRQCRTTPIVANSRLAAIT